ncbi:DENN domain-containing protein, partial [Schistosoma japonicum]
KTDKLIEYIAIFKLNSANGDPVVEYVYPYVNNENPSLRKLRNFVLPCRHKGFISEEYTLIFTDSNGNVEFFVCITLPISRYIVCVSSYLPYFELLHSLITLINQEHLYKKENRFNIEVILKELHQNCDVATLNISSPSNLTKLSIQLPDAQVQFVYHRHILEYYNTLSIGNWILIFESLLTEKSVIFYSSRLQRITSCLLASLSLLYPLIWPHLIYSLLPSDCIDYVGCPTPFVAGVHSCLKEKIKPLLNPGVRLVDLDNDIVYGTGDTGITMPSVLRHWLTRRCNASHSAILRHIRSTENVASTAALLLARPYLELMAILLGRYRSALQHNEACSSVNPISIPSSDDSGSIRKFDQPRIGGWHFDRASFVVSCGRELQPYLTELLNSQMVVQFLESRVAVLNSDLAMIPPDDFEDIIDHVSIPKRSGGLNDLLNFGRSEFDKITRKLTRKSEKLSQKLFNRPNNFCQTVKLNGSMVEKRDFNNSVAPKVYTKKPLSNSLSTQLSEHDICEILRKQLEFKDNKDLPLSSYPEKEDTSNLSLSDHSGWQQLSPQIDHELRKSERTSRSLLTSILAELPDFSANFYSPATSQINNSQVSLRQRFPNDTENKAFNLRSKSSKRMGCYVESPEILSFPNWVSFDSSPPTHHPSGDLINLSDSSYNSSNTFHSFSNESMSKSLSPTTTKPVECDRNQSEQAILNEFDQLYISRIKKT